MLRAVILAAGKGSRMKTPLPKVLHKIGGRTLLNHVITAAQNVDPAIDISVVLSPQMPEVAVAYQDQDHSIQVFFQQEQLGTAHALLAAEHAFQDFSGDVLVMLGDVPFIQPATLKKMLNRLDQNPQAALVVLAMHQTAPNPYGRLVTDNQAKIKKIVEVKDASDDEKKITLCNSGFFAVKGKHLLDLLKKVQPSPVTGEYYLTDIVAIADSQGLQVFYEETNATEVQGINTQHDLAVAEACFQTHARTKAMENGVTLIDPSSVYFSFDTQIASHVTIYPQVYFGPQVTIESGAEILSFSHLEGAHIKSRAKIGPFARIRPSTIIEADARIGNFVEIKNTTVGSQSKVNHLAYVGDSQIGSQCNIGAGTITVNYDGVNKWKTTIKDKVFIGSNSSLIAPLTIEKGAIIAAGSTITHDVAENALVFGRARQMVKNGGADRIRSQLQDKKSKRSIC